MERLQRGARALHGRDICDNGLNNKDVMMEMSKNIGGWTDELQLGHLLIEYLPLLSANAFPTARSHMDARSFVGIPFHQSFRREGFLLTTFQSGTISFSQICIDSSMCFSRVRRRSLRAFRLFSAIFKFRYQKYHG